MSFDMGGLDMGLDIGLDMGLDMNEVKTMNI